MEGEPKRLAPPRGLGKKVLVVKRKTTAVKRANGSLPTFGQKRRPDLAAAGVSSQRPGITVDNNSSETEIHQKSDYPFDDILAELPNDCALAIEHLQQRPNMSIAIPLPFDSSHFIHGVLEIHLHQRLQDASQQLAELLESNKIRRLTAPSRGAPNPLQVVLFTSDYERAARNTIVSVDHHDDAKQPAQLPNNSNGCFQPPNQSAAAVEWLIRQLSFLRGRRIAEADLREQWKADPIPGQSLDRILETLTRQQLLLGSSLEQYYQLWLPTWGVVLQAWETARRKVLMNLKRSFYKERSMQAVQQKYSPIPTSLLLDWMESMGQVEIVDRAAGKFVRLVNVEEEDDDKV